MRALAAALAFGLCAAQPATAAPQRVVSVNLCTDQLAMLLADEGQLVSVSFLSGDPRLSAMPARARDYPANRGQAEEVFLMRPDLVLAGTYTAQASVAMLRRLGIEVVEFAPARALSDVPAYLERMGRLLGREEKAGRLIAEFEAGLAALRRAPEDGPRAALYSANGYTTGQGTLSDDILSAAGLRNIAAEVGRAGGGPLPLELLVTAAPDLVITGARYPGASRAEALLDHPALAALMADLPLRPETGGDWVCGTPHVLKAIAALSALGDALEAP
ncbi:ABC transporter substrate-binding protein [Rhodovulum iodosum]|nr:ABC transporter substrate-binding protein [Rhodovulum robiginosum]